MKIYVTMTTGQGLYTLSSKTSIPVGCVPRVGDLIELAPGYCSERVQSVGWAHDMQSVSIRLTGSWGGNTVDGRHVRLDACPPGWTDNRPEDKPAAAAGEE